MLEEIFWFCLPVGKLTDPVIPDLLNISRVCTRWRAASLSAPKLWSYISLRDVNSKIHVPMLRQYMAQSKGSPLTVVLRHGRRTEAGARDQIYTILAHHYHRLKGLVLVFEAEGAELPILPLDSSHVPMLELIQVLDDGYLKYLGVGNANNANVDFWRRVNLFPSLKRVIWQDGTTRLHSKPFTGLTTTSWKTLTELEGAFNYDEGFVQFLSGGSCRSLESLSIRRLRRMAARIEYATICLPKLRKLDVCSNNLSFFINHLTLPLLEKLVVYYSSTTSFSHTSWVELFERSASRLRSLTLYGVYLNVPDEGLQLLLSSPALETITSLDMTFKSISKSNVPPPRPGAAPALAMHEARPINKLRDRSSYATHQTTVVDLTTRPANTLSSIPFLHLENLNIEVETWDHGKIFDGVDLYCRAPDTHSTLKRVDIKVANVLSVERPRSTGDWKSFLGAYDDGYDVHYTYARESSW
ncbi:hypothetical protein PQX77_008485 [Marasmius sp. AFHP31]|nr:hypothetical protein PQX77_008485 [Marasmius sp. AFHP31]